MPNDKSLLDEARQNILNICNDLNETMKIVGIIKRRGYKYFGNNSGWSSNSNSQLFNEGMEKAHCALYNLYAGMIDRAFTLSGVPNKEMQDYTLKKFKERFTEDEQLEIMSFLSANGEIGSYLTEDKVRFQKEINEAVKELK